MAKIKVENLNLWYGDFQALINVNALFAERKITAIIGPSGCGKSTMLRVFNRMNDLIEGVRTTGEIIIDGENILNNGVGLEKLRKKVGMVFQRPNPFPLSIYENIVFGEKIHAASIKKYNLDNIAEESLRAVLLWDDLKDKLHKPALGLSLEQKQRLCIARLIAVKPDILLMDEPCSALDPISSGIVEDLIVRLRGRCTIVIVTHNLAQARRVANYAAFFWMTERVGKLIEFGQCRHLFEAPAHALTAAYVNGAKG